MKRNASTSHRLARVRAALLRAILAVAPSIWLAVPSDGQVALDSVDALARTGRTEEARTLLETWWNHDRTRSSRQERQHALWLRALLTVDPWTAALDYQRLVVQYPAGPYSDGALVRLAMIADFDEDVLRAAGYYRILLQDYPRSPDQVTARQWLGAHAKEIEEAEAVAAQTTDADVAAATGEEPSVQQLNMEAPSVRGEALAPQAPRYAVQLGAFSTRERARTVAASMRLASFEIRLVRVTGSPLFRIRVGRFAERSQAVGLKDEIVGLGYDATVVSDAAGEERVR